MTTTIPETWKLRSIESVCTRVTTGGTPSRRKPEFFENGTIPWFKTGELKDQLLFDSEEHITDEALESSSAKVLPSNTVLMAMYGDGDTITTLGVLRRPAATNQACCAMMPDPSICEWRYLFYALKHTRPDLLRVVVGGAQRNLSGSIIRQHSIPLPPLAEQKAIASILGALDDKIELNRRMNATLEGMARALFQSWFVDFDPVRAKLDGRKPEGMDKATAALFPDAFEESSLGPVPKGWEVLELGDLLGKEGYVRGPFGSSLKRSDMDEEGVPVYEQQHAIYNTREFRFFISDEKHKTLKRFTVRGNDLIISCSGTVGRISIIRPDDPEGIISQALLILRPDTAKATPEFLFYYLTSPQGFHSITSVSSGSVQVNIAKRQVIEAIKLVVPPRALIGAYDELARSVREESLRNLKESSTLSLLRDTLLPKLLSGELSAASSKVKA